MANFNSPANKLNSPTCYAEGCSELRKKASNGRGAHRFCREHLNAQVRSLRADRRTSA